jgi:hypothetical protein
MPEREESVIVCARMYAVSPLASAAWRALFQWAARRARAHHRFGLELATRP